jgi:lipoprotein NlpD
VRYQRILILVLLFGSLVGCGQMRPMGSGDELVNYTVKPGDTLYSISWRYGYDHREVAAWNGISPPYQIYVGQRIRIISPYQRTVRATPPHTSSPASAPQTVVSKPAVIARAAVPDTSPAAVATRPAKTVEKAIKRHHHGKIDWRWPTTGDLRNRFNPSHGKKGLDIEGKMGQPILAAAGGKVVYSGDGLIGYGNLVIIKHNDTYLSAYGHNRRLLVKEGSEVKQGQKIAEMGDSGKQGVILHFEIRRDGKPVDPLRYLPKKGS